MRVVYVSRDKSHPLRGRQGVVLIRARGPGPRNELVRLDNGALVVAPWGNWRKVPQTGGEGNLGRASKY